MLQRGNLFMEENEKGGLLDKAMRVVEPQDLGTC